MVYIYGLQKYIGALRTEFVRNKNKKWNRGKMGIQICMGTFERVVRFTWNLVCIFKIWNI